MSRPATPAWFDVGLDSGVRAALLRAGGLAVLALLAGAWLGMAPPVVLCPLLRFTGVPCPLCGGTTAFAALGAGSAGRALAANPVVVCGAVALACAPLPRARALGRRVARQLGGRALGWLVVGVLIASELWQLHRFGLLASS